MLGKPTRAKFLTLGLFTGLVPCIALAVDMPDGISPERVDTSNLGMAQEGSTARAPAGWSVQIGAYVDKAKAEGRLDSVAQILPSELANATRLVMPLAWDEAHTVYRARFTDLSEQVAIGLCTALNRRGDSCFVSAPQESVAENDLNVQPAPRISPEAVDFGTITAGAIGAIADATPVLQEIAELPNPPPVASRAEAPALREIATPSGPPTVTGDVIAASAIRAPALRASLDRSAFTRTASVILAMNDKASLGNAFRRVSNDELSDMRGGFFTAAGAQFDFGASIQTMVNGQLALQTNLNWTPSGPAIQQLTGLGQSIQAQVQANLAKVGIGTNNGTVTPANAANTSVANTPVTNTPVTHTPVTSAPIVSAALTNTSMPVATPITAASITTPVTNLAGNAATSALNTASSALNSPSTPANTASAATSAAPQTVITIPSVLSGVLIPGANGGTTQILANINANQIQNIILNSASNQTISQNTNVSLTIYNFQAWQHQLAQNALAAQLAHEVLATSGFGH
jgi:hypothetical protein